MGARLRNRRKLLEVALKADGKMALAHENMGFLYFSEGRDAEAWSEFNRAYELDGKLYLSLFYRTMLSPIPRSNLPRTARHSGML